jgi:hypothetical protein
MTRFLGLAPNGRRVVDNEVAERRKPPGFTGVSSRGTGRLAPFRYNFYHKSWTIGLAPQASTCRRFAVEIRVSKDSQFLSQHK